MFSRFALATRGVSETARHLRHQPFPSAKGKRTPPGSLRPTRPRARLPAGLAGQPGPPAAAPHLGQLRDLLAHLEVQVRAVLGARPRRG